MSTSGHLETQSRNSFLPASAEKGLQYSSKLMSALNHFTQGLTTSVQNPLRDKYGEAYNLLVSGDALRYREDLAGAMEHYHQALTVYPNFGEAFTGLAKCLRRKATATALLNTTKRLLSKTRSRKSFTWTWPNAIPSVVPFTRRSRPINVP